MEWLACAKVYINGNFYIRKVIHTSIISGRHFRTYGFLENHGFRLFYSSMTYHINW